MFFNLNNSKLMEGKLVIISAPSGSGKTTIVKHLLQSGLNLAFSISATTRPLRINETDGEDYFFIPYSEFKKKIENNEFVEWEEVYKDQLYGTLKSELERIWAKGNHAIFDIDAKGGINLKKKFGTNSIALFIMPPSIEELENRLVKRGMDSPEKIRIRVDKAREELKLASEFDTIIINNQLDKAKEDAYEIVLSFINH
jgi:guanylate kinase